MSRTWAGVETHRLGAGAVGHIAQDPGDGRWLWSVTWAGVPDSWSGDGLVLGRARVERRGKANTRDAALDCMSLAIVEGRPNG
jgi:hypothetical protein